MKKQKIQLIILLVILVALAAAFIGIKLYNTVQSEMPQEVEGEIVIDMEYEETENFSYDYEGVTYSFERIDDVWYVQGDHSQNVKQYRIKAMLTAVAPLVAEQVIENVADLSRYGLAQPQRTIVFGDDIEQYTLYVGDYNSLSTSYYVCLPSSQTVYVVDEATISRFNYTVEDLVDAAEEASDETTETTEE